MNITENIEELVIWLALKRLGYSNVEINQISEQIINNYIISNLGGLQGSLKHNTYNFNHIASIITFQNKKIKQLCIGQNDSFADGSSQHAEVDAIHHLPPRKNWNRQLMIVDLIVIRVSKIGIIGNSMPCIHCLRTMTHLPHKMGYHINRIYYSNSNGEIVSCKLDDLIAINEQHITSYHRHQEKTNKLNINRIFRWREKYLNNIKMKNSHKN